MGFDVLLVGRRYHDSPQIAPRRYQTRRMHLLFRKGPLFYAEYNLRLMILLLFTKCDILLANDLDTLTANIVAGKLKGKPVVYDSHEYFTEVPELIHRPGVQKVWLWLEKRLVPKVSAAYTVCQSIADIYSKRYNIPFRVVRNVPQVMQHPEVTANLINNELRPAIIYQGALNLGRGLEYAIRAMQYLPEARLLIAGSGDKEKELQRLAKETSPQNIQFLGRLSLEELSVITRQASIGISIEEDLGLNYRYALPNKLFDYIQAQIPVVVSNLPEMKRVVEEYHIGLIANSHDPEYLAGLFRKALFEEPLRETWKNGLKTAANELNWNHEKKVIEEIFKMF
jgi:glycosyltransferase involved in cell wall biosynthesis